MECDWRYGSERLPKLSIQSHQPATDLQQSPYYPSTFDPHIVHRHSRPTSMIQPTLNSSDYYFQQFHIASTGRFSQHCIENRHRSSELQVQQPKMFPASHSAQSLLQHKGGTNDEQLMILTFVQGLVEVEQPPPAMHTMDPSSGIRSLFVCVVMLPSLSQDVLDATVAPCQCQWLWLAIVISPRHELHQFWPMYLFTL